MEEKANDSREKLGLSSMICRSKAKKEPPQAITDRLGENENYDVVIGVNFIDERLMETAQLHAIKTMR